jgi:hypothetical protein
MHLSNETHLELRVSLKITAIIILNMALALIHMHRRIHDNYKYTDMQKHKLKHHLVLILETIVVPPTRCRPSMNLPALDHTAHQLSSGSPPSWD